jgi:hypothetical protein
MASLMAAIHPTTIIITPVPKQDDCTLLVLAANNIQRKKNEQEVCLQLIIPFNNVATLVVLQLSLGCHN